MKRRRFKRNLATTGLAALILYAGVHLVSRTEGVRTAVADKISNAARQPVSLQKCGATPLLNLRIEGLAFQGVVMPEVVVALDGFALFSKDKPLVRQLRIRDLSATFKRVPPGASWEPLVLHGVGSRLGAVLGLDPPAPAGAESFPRFPAYAINGKTLLQLRGAQIAWHDERGRELASIADGSLSVKTAVFTRRRAIQTRAGCGQVNLASGRILRDFRLEAFRIEGSSIVTVLEMSDSAGQYGEFASATLWQDLGLHLSQLSAIR